MLRKNYLAAISKIMEPNFFEAVRDPRWMEAMGKEIHALKLNNI